MNLAAADFEGWMQAVHGQSPFPWQRRLLAEIMQAGWPRTIKLPTASGKTTALDVAVFALALEAQERSAVRRMPLRIAFVVDRRIVVDAAHQRAERIGEALRARSHEVVARVADALLSFGGEVPLHTALLRGGIYREDRWARQPNQPTILCSTVDQVGSRLLHRGYGLSPASWPIHAGLLGNDTLILLDEAHCSEPFLQTLDQLAALRAHEGSAVKLPWQVSAMTATPADGACPFELDEEDLAHPVLKARLNAPRPLTLCAASGNADRLFVQAMREAIVANLTPGVTLLAVVNRVQSARAIFDQLGRLPAAQRPTLLLMTGRARSLQRDRLLAAHQARVMAGRDRDASRDAPPLVVVATQCVEVGADFDVDVLVTEACPLDSLRQRLGRLNRLGRLATAPCTVVSRAELAWEGAGDPPVDPIYGTAVAETWRWLTSEQAAAPLDGGVVALGERAKDHARALDAPSAYAPIIFPEYCDLWAQTGPAPLASPVPATFLHGPDRGLPEVQLVWRADLDGTPVSAWADAVALCPPVVGETLAIRLHVARDWLNGTLKADKDDSSDLEGGTEQEPDEKPPATPRTFLCWRGNDRSVCSNDTAELRPGDTVVIPSSYGGCDEFGWNPGDHEAVVDLADEARVAARRAPVLRLHPAVVGGGIALAAQRNDEAPDDLDEKLLEVLTNLATSAGPFAATADALRADRRRRVEPHPSGRGYVLIGRAGWAVDARDFSDEDDSSSAAPLEVTLEQHQRDVRDLAHQYAIAVGLSPTLAADLAFAAHLHDLGKADPRFQAWLRDGSRVAALRGELLAKSPSMAPSAAAQQRARERAGYPRGGRHELLSVKLAESSNELMAQAHDLDLVLHLVASHHGHCRPFAPVVVDAAPIVVKATHEGHALAAFSETGMESLGSGTPQRFFRLLRKYGWWGLSYLEACVRLADHRASERAERRA